MHFTEDMFEQALIELFVNMGYTHIYAPDIERDYSSPLLDSVLMDSLVKLNKGLPLDAITEAMICARIGRDVKKSFEVSVNSSIRISCMAWTKQLS